MKATYTKLRDGSWGIRVENGIPKTGDMIAVEKRSGEKKLEQVGRFIKTYPDNDGKGMVYIFMIANNDKVFTRYTQKRLCSCTDTCCKHKCFCERSCNCRGGNIYDC